MKRTERSVEISVPRRFRQAIDTIVALVLEQPAAGLALQKLDGRSSVPVLEAKASSVYGDEAEWVTAKAFDRDPTSRWATPAGTHSAWIEADFGQATEVAGLSMSEACGSRIAEFTVQAFVEGAWSTVASGTGVGEVFHADLPSVRARKMRINITKASEGPTLWEVNFLTPGLGQ